MLWYLKKYGKYSRGIGIFHASFCYLTNGAQLLFSSAFRFRFQIIFQIILASFVPGLIVGLNYCLKQKKDVIECEKNTFLKNYLPSAKKSKLPSHQVFGVFALEVNKILQATPPKLRRETGMCAIIILHVSTRLQFLFERSEFLIDTSQKKSLRVCTRAVCTRAVCTRARVFDFSWS